MIENGFFRVRLPAGRKYAKSCRVKELHGELLLSVAEVNRKMVSVSTQMARTSESVLRLHSSNNHLGFYERFIMRFTESAKISAYTAFFLQETPRKGSAKRSILGSKMKR